MILRRRCQFLVIWICHIGHIPSVFILKERGAEVPVDGPVPRWSFPSIHGHPSSRRSRHPPSAQVQRRRHARPTPVEDGRHSKPAKSGCRFCLYVRACLLRSLPPAGLIDQPSVLLILRCQCLIWRISSRAPGSNQVRHEAA